MVVVRGLKMNLPPVLGDIEPIKKSKDCEVDFSIPFQLAALIFLSLLSLLCERKASLLLDIGGGLSCFFVL